MELLLSNNDIITELEREGTVRKIVKRMDVRPDDAYDLEQEIFLALLKYDNSKLNELWGKWGINAEGETVRQITFAAASIARNQYYSSRSTFVSRYKRFRARSNELTDDIKNNLATEFDY